MSRCSFYEHHISNHGASRHQTGKRQEWSLFRLKLWWMPCTHQLLLGPSVIFLRFNTTPLFEAKARQLIFQDEPEAHQIGHLRCNPVLLLAVQKPYISGIENELFGNIYIKKTPEKHLADRVQYEGQAVVTTFTKLMVQNKIYKQFFLCLKGTFGLHPDKRR